MAAVTFRRTQPPAGGLESLRMKCPLLTHPQRNFLRLQLLRHPLLAALDEALAAPLVEQAVVQEAHRGECLLPQGGRELRQFFVLEGLVKRTVCSPQGREMTLRFAGEGDFETCHDAWRRQDVAPYSVVCAARCCVASVSMQEWCAFMAQHAAVRQVFHDDVSRRMLIRNNRTSPYLWGFTLLTVIPAVLFWRNTPVLAGFTVLFIVSYLWAYHSIVRFRMQRWLRRIRLLYPR